MYELGLQLRSLENTSTSKATYHCYLAIEDMLRLGSRILYRPRGEVYLSLDVRKESVERNRYREY